MSGIRARLIERGRLQTWQESYKFPGERAGCAYCNDLGVQYITVYSSLYKRDIQVVRPCPHCTFGEQKERMFRDWREEYDRPRKPVDDGRPRNTILGEDL